MSPKKTSFPKQDIRVLLLEGISQTAVDVFRAAGYSQIELHAKSLPEDELKARIAEAHIVGIRSRTHLSADVLAHAKRLIAVGCFCIGTNQVDLEAAELAGIPVFNAPYSNTRSVAELVIAEAILLLRGIPQKNAECHRGGWSKSAAGSHETRGKVLGIVGYGHIGTQVGVLAESLGMQVIFHDIETKLSLGNARAAIDLDDLLARSDVVTLHVPETPSTKDMIGAAEIARMKPGAHLINASRGTVIDIDALDAALTCGQIGGAAVDVFPIEPKGNGDAFESPLIAHDNVILTPHVGGSTLEAQDNIGVEVAAKLVRYSDNGSTLSAVNFPEVTLPEHPDSLRLLHIHRNVPGVLSQINELFSRHNLNIDGQFLRTDPKVGYVVIDVSASEELAGVLKDELGQITGTLRTRVLY
ncbi:phosphoglycerate dehydrogenase [Xanthomonas campestris]|uniref:phosphoglycerate dehydrogenase n=1 Tax=Xanthomonas campestris TaxID=339 RepID=UPI002B23AFCD|nr:phosphoglycerate dehydrogenase [Xanthomonas campestris]MEA9739252.1 phosphoglycerate dehydrogenase [Xanthomonas campestris pv. raphani]MEA9771670.1 phosphoglycerate dehydrogenase [Xanthomonas campestris pv. raphani]MEA9798371.1 phosphoglycerate dehydrogenase [Xanthomonas campestris pv. raphani]MEA9831999.1 phosphoglycerate dehydrogenase [Xanthomonas campestris pv. raphani]MEA9922809.1 phosphoglycerate dehydrogenase [Xanthomonas campestris pv. raphani]